MPQSPNQPRSVRFGSFEVSFPSREIRKNGVRVNLPGQPFDILAILLERAGDVVTREELRQRLWPADTFVDFEHGMNNAVKRLRAALGDSADHPLYVETLARLGYRFIAPLEKTATTSNEVRGQPGIRWKMVAPAIVAIVTVVAVVVGGYSYFRRTPKLTEADSIVLSDFDNKTGDAVFDDTLRQGLSVQLEQSPFLALISDSKVNETLTMMGRPAGDRLTPEVTREVCQRTGSTAMLTGSIAGLGSQYVIGLKAVNCNTGDVLAEAQEQAAGKEAVLKALDAAAMSLRSKLGESLSSVREYATPLEEATTPSLEALKAYSMGRKLSNLQGQVPELPYLQQAVELDPNFALAHRAMAFTYLNLGQTTRASENAKKAFDLRRRVSERERYAIEATYFTVATGELEKANQVYGLWKQSYPRDDQAFGDLGNNYMMLGQWERALQETRNALRLQPTLWVWNSNLAFVQLALNRTEEARTIVEQALAHNMDTYVLRLALYQTAFLRGDQDSMQQQLAWGAERSREEDWLLSAQSDTEAYFGRLAKAREFSRQAIDSAVHVDAKETAALWQVNAALREAEFRNASSARHDAKAALALMPGKTIRSVAALSLARAGDIPEARRLADSLDRDFPKDTLMQGYWLPTIRAALELNARNFANAVELLRTTAPYEQGQCPPFQLSMMYPVYLRGHAHLLTHRGKEAAAEFQKIIDHRGIVLNFPLGALAHLGLGRAYALQGDTAKARAAYQDFLMLWKDADPHIPILKEAKAEYAKLQ